MRDEQSIAAVVVRACNKKNTAVLVLGTGTRSKIFNEIVLKDNHLLNNLHEHFI